MNELYRCQFIGSYNMYKCNFTNKRNCNLEYLLLGLLSFNEQRN